MSNPTANNRDLDTVLLRALDGAATREELDWLNATVRDDPQARNRAIVFLVDESLLAEDERTLGCLNELDVFTPHPVNAPNTRAPKQVTGVLRFVNRHGLAVAAIACTLLVALLAQNFANLSEIDRLQGLAVLEDVPRGALDDRPALGSEPNRRTTGRGSAVVGRVTALVEAQWAEGQTALTFGDSLSQGTTIDITDGLVELLLSTGAKVTLEGPARFEVSSPSVSTLTQGKIAAAVPRSARGYTVYTPTSEVVDIGTQFGLSVADSGDTELHVFKGEVVARSILEGASPSLIHAQQDEAMLFHSASDKPTRFKAKTSDFVRRIGPVFEPHDLPRLPITDRLGLWYAADYVPNVSEGDPVSTWHDLLVGDNDFADDAWQFDSRRCPHLNIDEAGRRALQFDGWSTYLATSPMETAERLTMFVVYAPGPTSFANKYHGGILLKYPVEPSLELAFLRDRSTRGWVWPGPDKQNVGMVRSKPVEDLGLSVVAYKYDAVRGEAELWSNGVSQGTSTAPFAIDQIGRRYIGSHRESRYEAGFFGNIYEVLIYDDAFDQSAVDSLTAYFADRYDTDFHKK